MPMQQIHAALFPFLTYLVDAGLSCRVFGAFSLIVAQSPAPLLCCLLEALF